jgi:hypothetical protein
MAVAVPPRASLPSHADLSLATVIHSPQVPFLFFNAELLEVHM